MDSFKNFLISNKGWLIGTICGLAVGIMLLTIGFFPTLLLALLGGLGALIGGFANIREAIAGWFIAIFDKLFKR